MKFHNNFLKIVKYKISFKIAFNKTFGTPCKFYVSMHTELVLRATCTRISSNVY